MFNAQCVVGILIVASLGDLPGPGPADEVLRTILADTGPGTADPRCAAVLALAKRLGSDATEDMSLALQAHTTNVKEYALLCLAAKGDGRCWEQVFQWLRTHLRRTHTTNYGGVSPAMSAVDYLLRHFASYADLDRLFGLVRDRWANLADRDQLWLSSAWPGLASEPSRPQSIQYDKLVDWSANALFRSPVL